MSQSRRDISDTHHIGLEKSNNSTNQMNRLLQIPNSNNNNNQDPFELNEAALTQQLKLDEIIIQSTLFNLDSSKQAQNIVNEFNKHVQKDQSAFTESIVRGRWINRDQFTLGHRNKVPELSTFRPSRNIARALNPFVPTVVTEILGVVSQTSTFYGAHGSYVLNVPVGKYALAWSGNNPQIYGPGPHVIHDQNFTFKEQNGLISQNEAYINHGNYHILRIPAGKVALIWIGSEPEILESRKEPYVFNDPLFRLHKNGNHIFKDATEECIEHGAIKRLTPRTGKVAITYNNGNLEIIAPHEDNTPHFIKSSSHAFDSFLKINLDNLIFPSESTKEQRRKESRSATDDEIAYEVFTTLDSLKIGVKLYVAYEVSNPELAIRRLGKDGIVPHIENLANIDMGKAIQQCSSQDFSNFQNNQPKKNVSTHKDIQILNTPSAPPMQHIQDEVKSRLHDDLLEYGIKLIRLNIETPKILNKEIADEMQKQALRTAQTNARRSTLDLESIINTTTAQQVAEKLNIELQQKNSAITSEAEAKLRAAQIDAERLLITAQAQNKAASLIGQRYTDNPQLLELEKIRLVTEALAKANYLPPQLSNLLNTSIYNGTLPFFTAPQVTHEQTQPDVKVNNAPRSPSLSSRK